MGICTLASSRHRESSARCSKGGTTWYCKSKCRERESAARQPSWPIAEGPLANTYRSRCVNGSGTGRMQLGCRSKHDLCHGSRALHSACRPASVIRNVATSIWGLSGLHARRLAVASLARTVSTICSVLKPCPFMTAPCSLPVAGFGISGRLPSEYEFQFQVFPLRGSEHMDSEQVAGFRCGGT
jgi:hypothetical protein